MKRILILLAFTVQVAVAEDFTMTVLHTNDVHAHLEPVKIKADTFGGFPRLATLIKRSIASDPNPILLSAGDQFQGTLYFNVYEGLADAAFMNLLGYRAMAVGNHEFDKGPLALARFCANVQFPVLAANLDVSADSELSKFIKPSVVLDVAGEKVGIVGCVTPDLPSISNPGPTVKLKPLIASVQTEIDALTKAGVNKIIVLSHCGFSTEEKELATGLTNVDVIVGGHSHTLLGKFSDPNIPNSAGSYPTVVKGRSGTVLVVQAWEWAKVLGRIKVTFDDQGLVKSWSNDQPILTNSKIPSDPIAMSLLEAFRKPIAKAAEEVVGESEEDIVRTSRGNPGRNPMGELICDAQLAAVAQQGAVGALMNSGGVRSSLSKGPIKYGDAIGVQPFGNTIFLLDLSGKELKSALEFSFGGPDPTDPILYCSSSISVRVDGAQPAGSRVRSISIYGVAVEEDNIYRIAVNSFLAGGGDKFTVLKEATGKRVDTGIVDVDALVEFFRKNRPVKPNLAARFEFLRQRFAFLW